MEKSTENSILRVQTSDETLISVLATNLCIILLGDKDKIDSWLYDN